MKTTFNQWAFINGDWELAEFDNSGDTFREHEFYYRIYGQENPMARASRLSNCRGKLVIEDVKLVFGPIVEEPKLKYPTH